MESKAIHFIASVDDSQINHIGEIVEELQQKGFHVENVRRITGTISGSVDNEMSLHSVNIHGLSIEKERSFHLK